jgi:hypothetical protein
LTTKNLISRWIENEAVACKRVGDGFARIAQHIEQVARGENQPLVPLPAAVVLPRDFRAGLSMVFYAFRRGLNRERALEVNELRREQAARCEGFIAALWDAIEEGNPRAITAALKALEHQARLFGIFQKPEGQVEINVAALMTLDLTTLNSKERQALMIRLFEIDGLPIEVARRLLESDGLDDDAPPEPHSARASRELPPPEEPSIITIEEARRSLEAAELDEVDQLPTPPDKA